jgi:hypothetical protein
MHAGTVAETIIHAPRPLQALSDLFWTHQCNIARIGSLYRSPDGHLRPTETFSTAEMYDTLCRYHLAIEFALFVNLQMNEWFTILVLTCKRQQRSARTHTSYLNASLATHFRDSSTRKLQERSKASVNFVGLSNEDSPSAQKSVNQFRASE